jgi:hypothetical protein
MRRTIIRALLFAVTVTAISLAGDLLLAVFHQGGPPHDATKAFLVFRSALHGATLVLTAIGAFAGFALLRSYTIANARIVVLAGVVGVFTLTALLIAFQLGGFRAMAVWLLLSSAVVSYSGGRLLGTRHV